MRMHLPVPAPYRCVEDLIVDALLLGSAFSIGQGFTRLQLTNDAIVLPITNYSQLSLECKRIWLKVALVLAQISFELDNGTYTDYRIETSPLRIKEDADETYQVPASRIYCKGPRADTPPDQE